VPANVYPRGKPGDDGRATTQGNLLALRFSRRSSLIPLCLPRKVVTLGFDPRIHSQAEPISHLLDKSVQNPLLPSPVKIDRQLVAFDPGNIAVAELDVKHAIADREFRGFVDL
jgi:hypothetical protein